MIDARLHFLCRVAAALGAVKLDRANDAACIPHWQSAGSQKTKKAARGCLVCWPVSVGLRGFFFGVLLVEALNAASRVENTLLFARVERVRHAGNLKDHQWVFFAIIHRDFAAGVQR